MTGGGCVFVVGGVDGKCLGRTRKRVAGASASSLLIVYATLAVACHHNPLCTLLCHHMHLTVFPIRRAGDSTIASEMSSQPPRFVNLDKCSLVATFGTLLK